MCEDRAISGLLALLVLVLVTSLIASAIWRRRASIFSARGIGVRADVGRLRDRPRVRVGDLKMTGPDTARLTLVASGANGGEPSEPDLLELVYLIAINESDFGFALLREWLERQSDLGFVAVPGNELLRLRSLDDLQPLTLRRLDG